MTKIALVSDLHYGVDGKTHNRLRRFFIKLAKEIIEQDIKVLIVAGDSASTRQRQFKRCFELIREFIDIPILAVKGNHDQWCGEDRKCKEVFNNLKDIYRFHEKVFEDNNIQHLDKPFEIDDIIICGFDGWYASTLPPSNDSTWMPAHSGEGPGAMEYLTRKAWKDFDKCMALDVSKYRKKIIVTHHNVTPYKGGGYVADRGGMNGPYIFYDEMKTKFDVLCYGHTHVHTNDDDNGFKVYNCGSDYNNPKRLIFEV